MSEEKPLVSVLISYYNDEKFFKQTIESALRQTYENFELILINHASTDSSREIAHSFDDNRIIHIDLSENMDAGGGFIIREFLKHAKGKYTKLFCADDVFCETCLEKLVEYLENNPDKSFVFGDAEYIDEYGNSLNSSVFKARNAFSLNYNEADLLARYFQGHSMLPYPSVLLTTTDLSGINISNTLIDVQDISLWVKLLLQGRKIGFIEDVVAQYRIHGKQMSGKNNSKSVSRRCYYELEAFYKLFLDIKNYEQLKAVCKYSPFIDKVSQEDIKYFPFIIAHYALLKRGDKWAYIYLNELLDDDKKLHDLKEKFNFGIKEFRKMYAYSEKSGNPLSKESSNADKFILFLKYPKYVLKYYVMRTKEQNKYTL